jgi:hypothetical protein
MLWLGFLAEGGNASKKTAESSKIESIAGAEAESRLTEGEAAAATEAEAYLSRMFQPNAQNPGAEKILLEGNLLIYLDKVRCCVRVTVLTYLSAYM